MTDNLDDLDITSGRSGTFIKKLDVEHGDLNFTIADAAREHFEARDGRAASSPVVLTSTDSPARKFSLRTKTNLNQIGEAS